ncbi:MAG: translocation/assembly module TamB domain-containing protein [Alphaproteobacteria bacterium]|nr:translocation/assembly module TamB domain-containing protein [Alphaproteobacteria bacterium]
MFFLSFFKLLFRIFLSTLYATGIVLVLVQIPAVKIRILEGLITHALSDPDQKAHVETVDGFFPFSIKASKVTLSDPKGAWLTVKDITLRLQFFPFRIGPIKLWAKIGALEIDHLPMTSKPISLKELSAPALLFVRNIQLTHIKIGPDIFGQGYDGAGMLALTITNQKATLTADLSVISPLLDKPAAFQSTGVFDFATNRGGVNANLAATIGEGAFRQKSDVTLNMTLDQDLSGHIKGSLAKTQLSINLANGRGNYEINRNPNNSPQSIGISSKGIIDISGKTVILKTLQASLDKHKISLKKEVSCGILDQNDGRFTLAQGCLGVDGGEIQWTDTHFNLGHNPAAWRGRISLKRIPLGCLQSFNPQLTVDGELSGDATLAGKDSIPSITGEFSIKSLSYTPPTKDRMTAFLGQKINSTTKFSWAQDSVKWQSKLMGKGAFELDISGSTSLENGRLYAQSNINAQVKGAVHLGVFASILPGGDRINGTAIINMAASGNAGQPQLKGDIHLKSGLYENATFGTVVRDIDLKAHADGTQIIIDYLTAHDGSITSEKGPGGQLTGDGHIDFKTMTNPTVDTRLTLTDFKIAQSDSFVGRASGSLALQGEGRNTKITGNLILDPAKFFLEEVTGQEIPTIHIVDQAASGAKKHHATKEEELAPIIPLDLIITIPDHFTIKGFGLDSTWQGRMTIGGGVNTAQISGSLTIQQGKLDLFGKAMKIEKGVITFNQTKKNDPLLDIVATRDAGDTKVMLHIEKWASDPQFTFLSYPALPEEQILALLLFGNSLEKISAGQSLQLASVASALQGKKGVSITDKIRSTFGIDTLELKSNNDTPDSSSTDSRQSLRVGKEFGKVRVSIDQGVSAGGTSKATLEASVAENLNVEVDVGGDRTSGLGLSWIKRY